MLTAIPGVVKSGVSISRRSPEAPLCLVRDEPLLLSIERATGTRDRQAIIRDTASMRFSRHEIDQCRHPGMAPSFVNHAIIGRKAEDFHVAEGGAQ